MSRVEEEEEETNRKKKGCKCLKKNSKMNLSFVFLWLGRGFAVFFFSFVQFCLPTSSRFSSILWIELGCGFDLRKNSLFGHGGEIAHQIPPPWLWNADYRSRAEEGHLETTSWPCSCSSLCSALEVYGRMRAVRLEMAEVVAAAAGHLDVDDARSSAKRQFLSLLVKCISMLLLGSIPSKVFVNVSRQWKISALFFFFLFLFAAKTKRAISQTLQGGRLEGYPGLWGCSCRPRWRRGHVVNNLDDCRLAQFSAVFPVEEGQIPGLDSPIHHLLFNICFVLIYQGPQQSVEHIACSLHCFSRH